MVTAAWRRAQRTGLGVVVVGALAASSTGVAAAAATRSAQAVTVELPPRATTSTAAQVQLIDTSAFRPASPDPSGITYVVGADRLLMVDSEANEVTGAGHTDTNLWVLDRDGQVHGSGDTLAWSTEPTGVDHDTSGGRLFVSDDELEGIHVVRPGPDGAFGTADDRVSFLDTAAQAEGAPGLDIEDPAFDPTSGHLFFAGGDTAQIFRVDPRNGVFGDGDDEITSFDVGRFGIRDAEALAHDPGRDTLVVGDRVGKFLIEVTKAGELVRTISITGAPAMRYLSGLEVAPRSTDAGQLSYWIVDRGRDNDNDKDENDGRILEIARAAVPAERLAGPDRIGSAVRVSAATFPSADTVVLARADTYPDALAGAPLAARLDAPILLSTSGRLSAATREEVQRLGAHRAVLLGGEAALGDAVRAELERMGLAVERLAGTDRFDTAARVAARVDNGHVYVTQGVSTDPGRGWPDAVSVSALAAFQGRPILLTRQESLPAATARALEQLGTTRATVVGGPAAVSDQVGRQLAATGAEVDRVAGTDRYDTSARVASRASAAGMAATRPWLATGQNFPDALTAGPAAAASEGVLLLVDGQALTASPASRAWLRGHAAELTRLIVVGGPAAVSDDVTMQAERLIESAQDGAR